MYRYLVIALVAGVVGGYLAGNKGYHRIGWFLLCTIVPPLLLVVLILKPKSPGNIDKKCVFCSQYIPADARICKFCGYDNYS